jgi:hypothetical protein
MLYPHSLLWHYLWVGPDLILVGLAFLTWRRGLHRLFPAFFAYLIFEAVQGLTMWVMDVSTSVVSDDEYWRSRILVLVLEAFVKLAVVWELFSHILRQRLALVESGRRLIIYAGAVLLALAATTAMRAPVLHYAILSYARIIAQSVYLIEAGLLLFVFLFAAHFHLAWDRRDFGIALGLSISACVGLGTTAVITNGAFFPKRYLLDFLDMGTYHLCVLIWCYYVLSPKTWGAESSDAVFPRATSRDKIGLARRFYPAPGAL